MAYKRGDLLRVTRDDAGIPKGHVKRGSVVIFNEKSDMDGYLSCWVNEWDRLHRGGRLAIKSDALIPYRRYQRIKNPVVK
jgi:hypothetical protein